MKKCIIPFLLVLVVLGIACSKNESDKSINLFGIDRDKQLGAQVDSSILASPAEYPILSEANYPAAYSYIRNMTNKILNSGEVFYRDEFVWEVKIIQDDDVLNAFCTPGGYIYVYTGLIKYLNAESDLAGVMGHEIAHADRRHSTDILTKEYGISFLLSILFGNDQSTLKDITGSLISLSYSRKNESEADEYSVRYLCPTDYKADGAAEFFARIVEEGGSSGPTFLSTHPDPGNRVENIRAEKVNLACEGDKGYDAEYAAFKNSLP